MSEKSDPVMPDAMIRAIDDARVLLDTLLTSGWQDIHVVSGGTEIFIAREGGRPNPMRQAAVLVPAPAPTSPAEDVVTAPHVATLVDALAVGTKVAAGDRIATIRVLDQQESVTAPQAGVVTAIHAQPGALVEFKAPIVSLGGGAQ